MELKNVVTKTAVVGLSALVLVACGGGTTTSSSSESMSSQASSSMSSETTSSSMASSMEKMAELKDGTYTLKSNEDKRGWAVDFTLVVKDGKITESNFDYVNAAGEKKSANAEYNKEMKEKTGVSAGEAIAKLNETLVKTQDVEVVTGATHTSEDFAGYVIALLEAAAEGNTETMMVTVPTE